MPKFEEVSISEARASLGELAMQVYYKGGTVMLTKNGKAIAALIQPEVAVQLGEKAQRYREALASFRERLPGKGQPVNPVTDEVGENNEGARLAARKKGLEALEAIWAIGIGMEMSDDDWEEFVQREVGAVRAELHER